MDTNYDNLIFGAPLAGGFFTGWHPFHRNGLIITAPKSMEFKKLNWNDAMERVKGFSGDWTAPNPL